jgi:hypothetical protein
MRELEDFDWFPESFRRHQMDFLSLLATKFGLYLPVKPHIETLMEQQEKGAGWTDACSGSGGPVISVAGHHQVVLTDLYPSFRNLSLPENIRFDPEPADISKGLPQGNGLITLFNSFHHFNAEQQAGLIGKCRAAGRPLLIVEILQPGIRSLLSVIFSHCRALATCTFYETLQH